MSDYRFLLIFIDDINDRFSLIVVVWICLRLIEDLVHRTLSVNREGTTFDVRERLVPVRCRCFSYCTRKLFIRYGVNITAVCRHLLPPGWLS